MELPAVNLKETRKCKPFGSDRRAIVFIHWLLTVFACMISWLPDAYYLANITVLAMGVWAIAQRDSSDAIFMFLVGLVATIVTDVLLFALYFAGSEASTENTPLRDLFRFSGGMAILSLILKPLSCFFSYHMYRERGGECSVNLGFLNVGRDRNTYQSIDHADAPAEQDGKSPTRSY